MIAAPSVVHARYNSRFMSKTGLQKFVADESSLSNMHKLGMGLDMDTAVAMYQIAQAKKLQMQKKSSPNFSMDAALQPLVTTPTVPALIQYLQTMLPGCVRIITAARKADLIAPLKIVGSWEDEQVVWKEDELTGAAVPYADNTNTPLANYNVNFNPRTVVRFELGLMVGPLAQARMARIQISDDSERRQAVAQEFEIIRNQVAFYGYNNGTNLTYGILNDANLPAYQTFPNGALGTATWATKTYLEIQNDIILMANELTVGSADTINPTEIECTLVVSTNTIQYLQKQNTLGTQSVLQWIKATYPGMEVISCPQFSNASSNLNVVYMFADRYTGDGSTDGGMFWDQLVQQKFRILGVQTLDKGYKESYTNALAGIGVYRPWMSVRYRGN